MLEINPFDSPEVKKSILGADYQEPADIDFEDLGPDDNESGGLDNFKNIISSAPAIPNSGAVKTIIKDAGALLKDSQEAKAQQMNLALSDIMTEYCNKYGLENFHVDLSSLTRTIVACSDERNTRILELMASRITRTIRPTLILMMISKLSLALEVLLAPENLLNKNELSLTDLFLATSTILDYIQKLEDLKGELLVPNDLLELKKLANENGLEYKDTDDEMVADFIKLFKKENGLGS